MSPDEQKKISSQDLEEHIAKLEPGEEKDLWEQLLVEVKRFETMAPEERKIEREKADEELALSLHKLKLLSLPKEEREKELEKIKEIAEKSAEEAEKEWQETVAGTVPILVEEDSQRRKKEAEILKNIETIEKIDSLIEHFKTFLGKNDLAGIGATLKKAALFGQSGTILNYYGYSSDIAGMHQFFNEVIVGERQIVGEMALENFLFQQMAYTIEYEVASLAECLNQWSLSFAVGRKMRALYQLNEKEHLLAMVRALKKIKPEVAGRVFGPLSYGSYIPREKFNLGAGSDFEFGREGKLILMIFTDVFEKQLARKEFNLEAANVLYENIDELEAIGAKPSFIEALKKFIEEPFWKPEMAEEVEKELEK